jgi:hypothetical protein
MYICHAKCKCYVTLTELVVMTTRKHMNWFTQIFKDNNEYNEKTIIGFISFAIMVITAVVDLGSGILGHDLVIKEYIYNSFVTVTLGSFGVAGLERFSGAAKLEAEHSLNNECDNSSEPVVCPSCGHENTDT